jgi:general secretion pathway protein A
MHKESFNFSENPFIFSHDPGFFFMTENHKEVLDSLVYGINEQKGFILLTGEVGTGKTTIIHELMTYLDSSTKAFPIYQPTNNVDALLEEVIQGPEFPLVERNRDSLASTFNNYLIERSARGQNSVLIIDEAQELSKHTMEELRLLSNQDPRRPWSLQEVFVGRPVLETTLGSWDLRQLQQRIAVRCRLRPLTAEETQQYIEFRLNRVGRRIDDVFTPEAVDLICRRSRGIIGNINRLCYLALSVGYALSKSIIGTGEVKAVAPFLRKLPHPDLGQKIPEKIRGLAAQFQQSPGLMKISYSLLAYSIVLWIVFLLLYWR